jgi:thymidylate kinase
MALYAAHKGYIYQDLVTACFFAEAIIQQYDEITVDRKLFQGDVLDDLTIRMGAYWYRHQVKHSDEKKLVLEDLKTGGIALNDLMKSHVGFQGKNDAQYTLCLRWDEPDEADILEFLQISNPEASLPGVPVSAYRINPSALWPEDGMPAWDQLGANGLSRKDFVELCDRLTIETQWPKASLDLTQPGLLENWLIETLGERVGIGKYPNENIDPVHVSSMLIRLATNCRAEGRTITPAEILKQIGIQTDFGRVPQKFPVIAEKLVHRTQFADQLEKTALENQVVVVTGPPGSGKSWSLSELADKLRAQGYAVGSHYCYLEPGDASVQQRIMTRTLFGNLVAELLDAEPSLHAARQTVLAADARELERMLAQASPDSEIILLVDGLDHISRVFQETTGLAPDEIDVVEQLAMLSLPPHTHLIVGSQPGDHLEPLVRKADVVDLPVPAWEYENVVALAERFDLEMSQEALTLLHERAEGNPLYATFLVKDMQTRTAHGEALDLLVFLQEIPKMDGDISRYYEYLAKAIDAGQAVSIMDILALVDFAITKHDLAEILPSFSHRLQFAIQTLTPVLTNVTGQGGIRIYHESFRRFIAERLRTHGVSFDKILSPVIDWLKNKDFYKDAKAYRFLPSLLRRAGLHDEVLGLITHSFAADSVAAGFSQSAIGANLTLVAEVAAESLDWPALARLAELKRSMHTCFEEKLNDIVLYGKTIASIHGPKALCERLLFEGRPTFNSEVGLRLCSLADDLGAVPPWHQYLTQYAIDAKYPTRRNDGRQEESAEASVAKLHGHIRLHGVDELLPKILRWLKSRKEPPNHSYLLDAFQRLGKSADPDDLLGFIEDEDLPADIRCVAREVYVSLLVSNDDWEKATAFLIKIDDRLALDEATSYARMGLAVDSKILDVPEPSQFDVLSEKSHHVLDDEISPVPLWVQAISLNALAAPELLKCERERVSGTGWYRQWLLYVIDLAKAEIAQFTDQAESQNLAVTALKELEPTGSPFVGTPRACDLYGSHRIIRETITRALNLLRDEHAWDSALKSLEKISSGTTTYLDGSSTGPLEPSSLAYLLLPYADQPAVLPCLVLHFEQQTDKARQQEEYYEVQAEIEMAYAQVLAASGDRVSADCHWKNACRYLTSYGFRKDITLLEIVEPISSIAKHNPGAAKEFLELTQPLVNGAEAHTDGRETRHFQNQWFSMLCKTDLALGLRLLARSLRLGGGVIDWRLESAVNAALDSFDPDQFCYLRLLTEFTLPSETGPTKTERSLSCIDRIAIEGGSSLAMSLFPRLAAHVLGDAYEISPNTVQMLGDFAAAHAFPLSIPSDLKVESESHGRKEGAVVRNTFDYGHSLEIPLFSESATPFQILSELKKHRFSASEVSDRHVNALGYRLLELMQKGDEEQAIRLIYAYTDQLFWGDDSSMPMSALAEGLLRFGQKQAAATAYMLAYTRSRGNGGWSNIGGREHFDRLEKAVALSEETTFSGVARTVAKIVESTGYNIGITQNLIEMFAHRGQVDIACSIWQAAFEVIAFRLSAHEDCEGPFLKLGDQASPTTTESGLVELLLSRISHPEYRRKNEALFGAQQILAHSVDLFFAGLEDVLRTDMTCCDMVSILQILIEHPGSLAGLPDSTISMLQQMALVDHEAIRASAQMLLQQAGKAYPSVAHDTARLGLSPMLDSEKRKAVISLDWGERVEELRVIWPELPDLVARRLDYLYASSETNKDKSKWRYQASVTRSREGRPVPLRDWPDELFELALNEVASGISKVLWQAGTWSDSIEFEIGTRLLPNHKAHLRVIQSRCVRPYLKKPENVEPGITKPSRITGPDEYEGWYRVGYMETQMVTGRISFDVDREVSVFAGAIVGDPPKPGHGVPLGKFSFSSMWPHAEDGAMLSFGRINGPLVGLNNEVDCNGNTSVLGLLPWLRNSLGLKCNQFPDPLCLLDGDGVVHVAYRYWWSGALWKEFDSEIPRLEGCELLVSSEAYDRIKQLLGGEPLLATAVL